MNKMILSKSSLIAAFLGAAVVACGASDGGNAPGAGAQDKQLGTAGAQLSVAEQFVADNTQVDEVMHLVARKFLNNNTEVAMFHEPLAGHIMFSIGGSPVGQSVLNHDVIEGKTASELWTLVAPGEAMPDTLAQAIERSKNPAALPVVEAHAVDDARPEAPQFGAPAPAVETKGEALLSGGYCSNGTFWSQYGNNGVGAQRRTATTFNYGWVDISYSGVTSQSAFAVCPQGNVSNTGGWFTMHLPNGTVPQWHLNPDGFVYTGVWTAGQTCGWDISCGNCGGATPAPFCQIGGTRCTPNGFNIEGRFDSQCYLDRGSSCGDNFDWVSWASFRGSYCNGN
jgi:hypothetical protein